MPQVSDFSWISSSFIFSLILLALTNIFFWMNFNFNFLDISFTPLGLSLFV